MRHSPRRNIVLYPLTALLWLVAIVLILEVAAAFDRVWLEGHNPFIVAAKAHAPMPTGTPASRADHPAVEPCSTRTWSDFQRGAALPQWAQPRADESREAQESRRRIFPMLARDDRNLFALVNDEIILELDANAAITGVYGNWLYVRAFERGLSNPVFESFRKQIAPSLQRAGTALPAYAPLLVYTSAEIEDKKEVYLLPGASPEQRFAFIPSDYKTMRIKMPEDTPWDGPFPFFRYKKNLRNAHSGLRVALDTNNFGFRDRDVAVPKPANTIRMVCVGASTTEEGSTSEATYPKRLEKRLNAQFSGGKAIEVLNCGTSGLTTSAHLARLADYLALEPDLLILYEGVNDVHRDLVEYWRSLDAPWWRRMLSRSQFLPIVADSLLYPSDACMRESIRGLSMENLRVLGRVAQSRNIRVAVCSVTSPDPRALSRQERHYFDFFARTYGLDPCLTLRRYRHILHLFNEEAHALCDREGYLFLPVDERIIGGVETFGDIYHLTDAGVDRKADAIFECLKIYLAPAMSSGLSQ